MTGNHCFEFNSFDGSSIVNNFIDYYQTIYHPYSNVSFSFVGGISANNRYQVFRYLFIKPDNSSAFSFNSQGDSFAWTLPSSLSKLASYDVEKYTGHDNAEHDIPECILIAYSYGMVSIKDAIILSNVGNLIFVYGSSTYADYCFNKLSIAQCTVRQRKENFADNVQIADALYNHNSYHLNKWDFPFIKVMTSKPSIHLGWLQYYLGQLIEVNNVVYRFCAVYNETDSSWSAEWVDVTNDIF
jgi:hypothetical protein